MKKRFLYRYLLGFSCLALFSCKKTLDNNYLNPDLNTTGNLSQLFTGIQLNNRIHISYWDCYTMTMSTTGVYSQFFSTIPADLMYVPSRSYTDSRWSDYYDGSISGGTTSTIDYNYDGPGIMSNYKEMERTYSSLSASDQINQFIYLQLAKVILYDQTSQMVDLYGDIPYSEANSLNSTAGASLSYAKFDDAATIYNGLISGLDSLNSYLDTATISSNVTGALKSADLIYSGDITKWRRYVNSLRLRLLMRISNVNESTAKTEVLKMLGDPTNYPLVDDNSYNSLFNQSPTTIKSDLQGAIGLNPYASNYLMDTTMQMNGDPRLDLFFSKDKNGKFEGFPSNVTATVYNTAGTNKTVSTIDSATFIYNYNVPGVLFTAAETNFLEAEAFERWGGGDAATVYQNGITQSIAFYYSLNVDRISNGGLTWSTKTAPTANAIASFIANANIAYSGTTTEKLAKIYTQKWVNYFILQAGQAWAEIRRTGYPKIPFAISPLSEDALPPNRIIYPINEITYNSTNYAAVESKDTRDTKIFWDVN